MVRRFEIVFLICEVATPAIVLIGVCGQLIITGIVRVIGANMKTCQQLIFIMFEVYLKFPRVWDRFFGGAQLKVDVPTCNHLPSAFKKVNTSKCVLNNEVS